MIVEDVRFLKDELAAANAENVGLRDRLETLRYALAEIVNEEDNSWAATVARAALEEVAA